MIKNRERADRLLLMFPKVLILEFKFSGMIKKALHIFLFFVILFSSLNLKAQNQESLQKLRRLISIIDNFYVDSVNMPALVEKAVISMMKELDPHSVYIPKEDVKALNDRLKGSFDGIGIQYSIFDDTLYVLSVIDHGPAANAGLRPGDRILTVNDELLSGTKINNSIVRQKLGGPKGSQLKVVVQSPGNESLREFILVRDKIPQKSIDVAYMVDQSTAYIKLNRFTSTSYDEFMSSVQMLKEQGMEKLILDLTGNGGGYLNIVVKICDELLSSDKLIVYTKGSKSNELKHFASNPGIFEEGRLVVLVNQSSASASEILAGAIQDWDRGLIVGRRSFGKGLVQRQFPLPDSSAIRLTIAHYYTPTGRSIQRHYLDIDDSTYFHEFEERIEHGELFYYDSIPVVDSLVYYTKMNGRKVYGGGGIYPDVFVPVDSNLLDDFYIHIRKKALIRKQAFYFVDRNRLALKSKFPSPTDFILHFQVDSSLIRSFKTSVISSGINWNSQRYELLAPMIENQFKALVGQYLYGDEVFYKLINRENPVFNKAYQLISSSRKYNKIIKKGI